MHDTDERRHEVTIPLDPDTYQHFEEVSEMAQQQLVYDAWRRTMQNWQHTHPDNWRAIEDAVFEWDSIKLFRWDESDHEPDEEAQHLQFDPADAFTDLDSDAQDEFLTQLGRQIEIALDGRFSTVT